MPIEYAENAPIENVRGAEARSILHAISDHCDMADKLQIESQKAQVLLSVYHAFMMAMRFIEKPGKVSFCLDTVNGKGSYDFKYEDGDKWNAESGIIGAFDVLLESNLSDTPPMPAQESLKKDAEEKKYPCDGLAFDRIVLFTNDEKFTARCFHVDNASHFELVEILQHCGPKSEVVRFTLKDGYLYRNRAIFEKGEDASKNLLDLLCIVESMQLTKIAYIPAPTS